MTFPTDRRLSLVWSLLLSSHRLPIALVVGALLTGVLLASSPARAQVQGGATTEDRILRPSDTQPSDRFGAEVAMDGTLAVVGAELADGDPANPSADAGAAYVFERTSSGTWAEADVLWASDAESFDYLGYSVDVSGSTVAVGAPKRVSSFDAGESGAVYVYEQQTDGTWAEQQILGSSMPEPKDQFGYAVALDGDRLVVGAPTQDQTVNGVTVNVAGAVYVFERQTDGTWTEVAVLRPSAAELQAEIDAGSQAYYFGEDVAIANGRIFVGATRADVIDNLDRRIGSAGKVFVYENDGTSWQRTSTLPALDPGVSYFFGNPIAASGDRLVVGMHIYSDPEQGNATGIAYVYDRAVDGSWVAQRVQASNEGRGDQFGWSVDVDGDRMVVGAYADDGPADDQRQRGAAYRYVRQSDGTWAETHLYRASNGEAGDQFGAAAGIAGDYVIVAADTEDGADNNLGSSGAGYLFETGLTSAVTVEQPIADLTLPVGRSEAVELRDVFRDSELFPLTYSVTASDPAPATIQVNQSLGQLTVAGDMEGTTTVTVTATSASGSAASDEFTVTVEPAPPEFDLDVRVVKAAPACDDLSDPTTCDVPSELDGTAPRSDTLEVEALEKVLLATVLTNTGAAALDVESFADDRTGYTSSPTTSLLPGETAVYRRIVSTPTAVGPSSGRQSATATTPNGASTTRRDAYRLVVQPPAIQFTVLAAAASELCTDVSDLQTCDPVDPFVNNSPRPSTLALSPGDRILVRYTIDNDGTPNLRSADIAALAFDPAYLNESVDVSPGDSLVVRRLYDVPSTPGTTSSQVTATVQDAAGNEAQATGSFTVEVPAPQIAFRVRVDKASELCSDVTDPSSCLRSAQRPDPSVPDTVRVAPGEEILVTYVAQNPGSTTLENVDVTDTQAGGSLSLSSPARVPPLPDSLEVRRIYNAPSAAGFTSPLVTAQGFDVASNPTPVLERPYVVGVSGPQIGVDVRITRAADLCTDVTDLSTCGIPRTSSPDSVTVEALEPLLVRYVVENEGPNDVVSLSLEDALRGITLSTGVSTTAPIEPGDTLAVQQLYDAPAAAGIASGLVRGTGADGGGNTTAAEERYWTTVRAPRFQFDVRIGEAAAACTDVTDASTCDPLSASLGLSPRPDTIQVEPTAPVVVQYHVFNDTRVTLRSLAIDDPLTGPLPTRTVDVPVGDSSNVFVLLDAPATSAVSATATVTGQDAGGNAFSTAETYGIELLRPDAGLDVRIAPAADLCTNETDVTTCADVTPYDGSGGVRPDTLTALPPGTTYVVRYVADNPGPLTWRGVEIRDPLAATPVFAEEGTTEPGDSVYVQTLFDAASTPGLYLRRAEVSATDAGGNTAVDSSVVFGTQTAGPMFDLSTLVGPASLFCTDVSDPTTCSTQRYKTLTAQPARAKAVLAKAGSDREAVLYRFENTGTVPFVRHTLSDNVVGVVFADSVFTVAPLAVVELYRIYDDVALIGESRASTWTTRTEDGEILSAGSTEEPLPVELAAFDARVADRSVQLDWTTASEENNAGFEVQRFDADAGTWAPVVFVPGAGTSSEPNRYHHVVDGLEADVYRFRLRQVDLDGRFAVSKEVEAVVALDDAYRLTAIAPHPVRDAGSLQLTVREAQTVRIEMIDLLGRRVAVLFDGKVEASRKQDLQIQTQGLASGTYFLRATGETFTTTQRVTVLR